MIILVTGAGGTVGSAVVEELASMGQPVRVAHRSTAKADRARRRGFDNVTIDMTYPATLGPALDGADAVFLVGATGPDQVVHETNVVPAAAAHGTGRIAAQVDGPFEARESESSEVHCGAGS